MNERTNLVRLKVERANKHIRDLQDEKNSFLQTKPYVVSIKRDEQTRRLIYYLASVQEPPRILSLISGDVLQNLRSALDHLAFQLVLVAGNTPTTGTYFPTGDTAERHESGKSSKVLGMRPDAIKAIDAVKPYKGGNDTLWRLHKLNNIDKHRLLISVGSAFHSLDVGAVMKQKMERAFGLDIGPLSFFVAPADKMFPLKQGDQLFIDEPDAQVNEKLQFRFDVSFGERQIADGETLVETLKGMSDMVNNLIADFDSLLA